MVLRATPGLRRRPAALTRQRQDSPDGPPFSVRTCSEDTFDGDDALDGSSDHGPDTPPPAKPEPLVLRLPEVVKGHNVFRQERSSRRTADNERGHYLQSPDETPEVEPQPWLRLPPLPQLREPGAGRSCRQVLVDAYEACDDAVFDLKWRITERCRRSLRLAFLSHGCFLVASILYLQLALVDLAWERQRRRGGGLADEEDEDDSDDAGDFGDEPWETASAPWEQPDTQTAHDQYCRHLYLAGAVLFVLVGLLDWLRHADALYAFMVLAGLAGVMSGLSATESKGMAWDCVSNHLYLIEAYTLVGGHKKRRREGAWQRMGDICFLLGCLLDVAESDCDVAGAEAGGWLPALGLTAQVLWLTGCSCRG